MTVEPLLAPPAERTEPSVSQETMPTCDLPHEPFGVDELGTPRTLVADIALRRALLDGETSTVQLAEALCVSPMLMEEVVEDLRHSQLIEVHGLVGRNYLLAVTDAGHERAMESRGLSRYAGPVPVSLDDYTETVRRQDTETVISHKSVRRAFSDLVMADELLDSLGPAIRSDGAIFLYGPPGTGKSAIAERLIRVHHDAVLVPHTIEIDGQIITVFDPVVHRPIDPQPARLDRRWVLCRRPSVIVGGELTASQLDLTYEPHAGTYLAPLQMQANNGILVIDDFGRQTLTPEQLLNRWIVPLDRGIDYLALDYGVKFEVPCATKIVFSTNLEPSSLADEAFFRRIRSKVMIPPIEDDAFDEILGRVAWATAVDVTPDAPAHLRQASRERGDGDLRPYLPGAVCELVRSITSYDDTPAVLDPPMIDRIVELYFTQDPGMRAAATRPYQPPTRQPTPRDDPNPAVRHVLDATHRLIWAATPHDVVAITERLAAALQPPDRATLAADDMVTVPAIDGVMLATVAPQGAGLREALEHELVRFVVDARRSLELTSIEPGPAFPDTIDPETGLPNRVALNPVLARMAVDDVAIVIRLDTSLCPDESDRQGLLRAFGRALASETRGHDHFGRYAEDRFIVVLSPDASPGNGAAPVFLDRLRQRWSRERPSPAGFSAGTAAARPDPSTALVAAEHAADRADPQSDVPWVTAVTTDYQ